MYDNYNYPPGADGPDAPWNQEDTPEKEFEVTISQTLSKNTTVCTADYCPGGCYPETEWDIDGYHTVTCYEPDDTSDTDWVEAYKSDSKTPLELIALLKGIVEGTVDINKLTTWEKESIIENCSDWVEDELVICED